MRNYTDKQLLDRFRSLQSASERALGLPKNLIIGVRSQADTPDAFDDKIYVFINGEFKLVAQCTTNPGAPVLLGGWKKYNSKGAAILKADEIYYDAFRKSNPKLGIPLHNGKMTALIQVKKMLYYRDGNNDNKIDETGTIYFDNYATNIHFNNYDLWTKIKNTLIGGWSAGCQVLNDAEKYRQLLDLFEDEPITYCLLKEFVPTVSENFA